MKKQKHEKKVWIIISLFSFLIILISTFSQAFTLADISALGLMLIALQALHLTSQQIGEWRRKDAKSTCIEIEDIFYSISSEIIKLAMAAKNAKKGESSKYSMSEKLKPKDIIFTLNKLNYIDTHLAALDKESIRPAIKLIETYLNTLLILPDGDLSDIYSNGKEFSFSIDSFLESVILFNQYSDEVGIYATSVTASPLRILHFYQYLVTHCITK